ncbi:MAG: phytanoyl-CoA dioxygenase family protein [Pseudomonadota bacterium]
MTIQTATALQPLFDRHMQSGLTHIDADPDWLGLWERYDRDGYVIIENVLDADRVQRIRTALNPHLIKTGRNDFEGLRSHRVYALVDKGPELFGALATHPLALSFVERELGASCLLSAMLAIQLLRDETVQDWHCDDEQIAVPRPRPAYGVSTFWAIDDTTEENGATEIIPGSHLWGPDMPRPDGDHPDRIKATMPSGSLMIAKGNLYHRGGANRTDSPRLIITPQYCPGWARPLENMSLAVDQKKVARMPKRLRELLGYNIHAAFMGYVDGQHPDRVLGLKKAQPEVS